MVNQENETPSIIQPITSTLRHIPTCFRNKSKSFSRIEGASGILKPGSMTLVLSPPGHGKSSFLKAISSRLRLSSGTVYFNGRTSEEAEAEGVNIRKLTQYVEQVDSHLALLTVHETLDFAHKVSSRFYDPKRVEAVISILGLDECKDTIIGDAMIRGVSGGQRRRVSIGEMLVGDARAIFLDEFSNGLDTATSEDIGRGLREWVKVSNASIISTLQQPTPGMLELFDDVILMRDANIVYQGPRQDILPYLASMGFHCPDDVDVCDFIIDCLSQPRVTIANQRITAKKSSKPILETSLESSLGVTLKKSDIPCVTTESMITHYKQSPFWSKIKSELDQIFTQDKQKLMENNPLLPSQRAKDMYSLGYALPMFSLLKVVFSRQAMLTFRNKAIIAPRIFQAIIMGLIYGSLYYQSADENFFTRTSALVISLGQVTFGSMIELSTAVQTNPIAFKQVASRFFPAWMYASSVSIADLPVTLVFCAFTSFFIYFMNGAVSNGVNFILYFLILSVCGVCLGLLFRTLSTSAKSEASAQALAGPASTILITFSGLFLSPSAIPDWLIWLYWISPFSWAARALANNEFLHHKYDGDISGVRQGTLFLQQLDMRVGHEWIGYAFIYIIALTVVLVLLFSFGLTRPYYEISIGTRRTQDEEEIIPEDVDEDETEVQLDVKSDTNQLQTREISANEIVSRSASAYNENALKTMRDHLPIYPTWLSFRDIKYTVPIIKDKVKTERVLLQGISGYAEPGKLTALMGASGAGKTTLLDVLAGRKSIGVIEGSIKLNGHVATQENVAQTTGYVEQFDSLLAYDTVRETLAFAARLRLPSNISEDIKMRVVDEIMDILELTSIQDLIIGNSDTPGLSPSQLKRVNIGVELVANPAVLFLDEPTTGLDSRAAQTVMRVVRRIARSGRSVICTIHQPSAELFFLFDRLVLLANGGYQIYFGDLGYRSKRFIKYLSEISGVKPIPPRYNPASWMLEELGVGVESVRKAQAEADGREYETTADMIQRFGSYYYKSPVFTYHNKRLVALDNLSSDGYKQAIEESRVERHIAQEEKEESNKSDGDHAHEHSTMQRTMSFSAVSKSVALPEYNEKLSQTNSATQWQQFINVLSRHIRMYWRSDSLFYARLSVASILAVVFGLIFYKTEITNQATAIQYISGIMFANQTGSLIFTATSLARMMDNRPVFYREKASRFYQGIYWGLSSFLAELPWLAIITIIGQVLAYFSLGLSNDAGKFFKFTLSLYCLSLAFIANSVFASAISPSPVLAQAIQGLFMSFFFIFMGLAIPLPLIPKGYVWLYHALPTSHGYAMLVMPQLEACDPIPNCGPIIEFVNTTTGQLETDYAYKYLADYLGWKFYHYWTEFGYLCIYVGVLVAIGLVGYQFCNFAKR